MMIRPAIVASCSSKRKGPDYRGRADEVNGAFSPQLFRKEARPDAVGTVSYKVAGPKAISALSRSGGVAAQPRGPAFLDASDTPYGERDHPGGDEHSDDDEPECVDVDVLDP